MSLNIENARVHELAREAARRTGQTQTGAVESALEAYLERLVVDDRRARIDRLLALVDHEMTSDTRAALRHDDLYDAETGLPR